MQFTSRHPQYEFLRKKWLAKQRAAQESFLTKHSDALRHLTLGSLGTLVMLTHPGLAALPSGHILEIAENNHSLTVQEDKNSYLVKDLAPLTPQDVRKLTPQEEAKISQILSQKFAIKISPEIDGIKLNRSYGLIGGEQHLYRYPGDTLAKHFETVSDWAMYYDAGIAPALGAWGYFAASPQSLSQKDKLRERYYIAVQTFLTPGFAENPNKFRDFFKYRKMLVVNPKSGQSVVTDIADAGPAEWTGKHLGGSPEVMHYLGLAQGPRKGEVLYFFIDDPNDNVPLGPIQVQQTK